MVLLDGLERGARILVVRLRSMGDCVLTTPALFLLHQHRPDLEIGVVVEDRFAAIYSGLQFVRSIMAPDVAFGRSFEPQLCLNLHGGTRSAMLTATCGARLRAGFGHFRNQFIYNVRLPRAQEVFGEERPVHTAEHVASAVFHLGVPRQPIPRAILDAQEHPESGSYAVIHPFASSAEKTWSAANFLAAARQIQSEKRLEPIILAGPGDDTSPFAEYRIYANRSLETVKGLIRGASYFLGNDSGPAHIAAAFDIPLTVVFGPSDPKIWGPWRASQAAVIAGAAASEAAVMTL